MTTLARIVAPHFVAGIVLTGARVTEAAPIVCYMTRWGANRVKAYCDSKGWAVARVTA